MPSPELNAALAVFDITPDDESPTSVGVTYAGPPSSENFNPFAFSAASCIDGFNSVESVHESDSAELGEENWEKAIEAIKVLVICSLALHSEKLKKSEIVSSQPEDVPGFSGIRVALNFARMNGMSRSQIFPQEKECNPTLSNVDRIVYQESLLVHDIIVNVAESEDQEGFTFLINPDTIYMLEKHHLLQKGARNPYALTGAQLKIVLSRYQNALPESSMEELVLSTIDVTQANESPEEVHGDSGSARPFGKPSDAQDSPSEKPQSTDPKKEQTSTMYIGGDLYIKHPGDSEFILVESAPILGGETK